MSDVGPIVGLLLSAFAGFFWLFTLFDVLSVPVEVWTLAGRNKAAWIFLTLFLPLLGTVFYWLSIRPTLRLASGR